MSSTMRRIGTVLAATALAGFGILTTTTPAFAATGPAGMSPAINSVPCSSDNQFTKMQYLGTWGWTADCEANRGTLSYGNGVWTDYIWSGNNLVWYQDCNGSVVQIQKWSMYNPSADFCVKNFYIM